MERGAGIGSRFERNCRAGLQRFGCARDTV
jgi:hypothetical protein